MDWKCSNTYNSSQIRYRPSKSISCWYFWFKNDCYSTVAGNRAFLAYTTYNNTSSARLTNWIDTQFGNDYLIKVYKGDPNSGGVALSASGSGANDGWFFDYSAGVLNFNDTNVPSGVTGTNIYIVGYRYIGITGAPTPGDNFRFTDLVVDRNGVVYIYIFILTVWSNKFR